jgi:hypothetical protein
MAKIGEATISLRFVILPGFEQAMNSVFEKYDISEEAASAVIQAVIENTTVKQIR